MINKQNIIYSALLIYTVFFIAVNLFLLKIYPFVHTDEIWLAGLSQQISISGSLSATEPFFDLVPRAPHAIKLLFHAIQIVFIRIFGYGIFSVRLFSLLTGAGCLIAVFRLAEKLGLPPLPTAILLSVDIQFIYASHFARQEVQLLLLLLLTLNALVSGTGSFLRGQAPSPFRRGLLTGLPIAAAVGFHPNAFIIAWPAGLFLLWEIIRRRRSAKEGLGFLLLPAASAVLFVLLSFSFNSGFVSDYGSFGEEVGVFEAFDVKLLGFDDFYRKLFLRISGTYHTPRIQPLFALAAIAAAALTVSSAARLIRRGHSHPQPTSTSPSSPAPTPASFAAVGLIGINFGIMLLGKYSAPSVVFNLPFLVLLIATGIARFEGIMQRILFGAAAAVLLLNSAYVIIDETRGRERYDDFTANINSAIPTLGEVSPIEGRVLGPLTAEFALEPDRLLDWRNLTMLRDAGLSIEDYVEQAGIVYIIYTEEYDVIYANRPVWNVVYGNPTIYHDQLQEFLSERCELITEFASPGYGTRIVLHREKKDWSMRVYRVE